MASASASKLALASVSASLVLLLLVPRGPLAHELRLITNYSVTMLGEIHQQQHTHTRTGRRKHTTILCIMRNVGKMEKSRTICALTKKKKTQKNDSDVNCDAAAKLLRAVRRFLVFVLSTRFWPNQTNAEQMSVSRSVYACVSVYVCVSSASASASAGPL